MSQIGIELFDEPGCIAGLNLYFSSVGAFGDDTVESAMLFAIQAVHTLGRVLTHKDLTAAMTTSTTIGRATGVVMQLYQLGPDRAVELLTRVSRMRDVPLETLADQILDEVTNASEPATDERVALTPGAEGLQHLETFQVVVQDQGAPPQSQPPRRAGQSQRSCTAPGP